MNRLKTLQKKAIRSIEHHKTHTEPICKKYGLLTLKDEYNKNLKILAWQIIRGMTPLSIKKRVQLG